MPPAQPGPSKPKAVANGTSPKPKAKGRVANFFSDDDEADHERAAAAAPANGVVRKKRRLNDKHGKGKARASELERVAAELLVKRYELPFYQGA